MLLKERSYTIYTAERLRRRRRRRIVGWSLATLFLLIIVAGSGAYLWLHLQVKGSQTTDAVLRKTVDDTLLDSIDPPNGVDILVLGSDSSNPGSEEERRSDTIILVHVDPDENYLSMLSFPRDLRVEIPEHGINKLNAAYALGGPALTVKTVEWLTDIDVDKYLEVDFSAFADITDAFGGVYLDVDRRYYNDDPTWELIKLSPGYQLLDGASALDYVRFRQDLNLDFGRMDRQQRFIAAVREQALGWNLARDLPGMVRAVFDNVITTLDTMDILRLSKWGLGLDGSRIRQITLRGDSVKRDDGMWYVVSPEGAVREAVKALLTPPEAAEADEGVATSTSDVAAGSDVLDGTSTAAASSEEQVKFTTDPSAIENSRLWYQVAAVAPFAVRAPGYLPKGYAYVDRNPAGDAAVYNIDSRDGRSAFKMVYRLTREGEPFDQFMGIMQTSWLDAPAAGAGQKVESNGIEFTIVGTDQRVERIWWKVDNTLYWVSNTLSYYLSKKELMRVAESMILISADGTADSAQAATAALTEVVPRAGL